ncbi:ribonuclease H-like domain-containing protein [Desulfovibrio sp. OttesenSCG-928-A18]|nr:ribonuclease H-like domain-containing protein [Desulfovibrio sp. OttesenSCG-928-A18]
MAIIWLDIETVPSPNKPDPSAIATPANYKDPKKIEEYQLAKVDDTWREEALNSARGRVLCIGWAVGNSPAVCRGIWDNTEAQLLECFNDVVQHTISDRKSDGITWGGFNLREFDLNWIWHRAVKHDLAALLDFIPRERFAKNVLDVRERWTGGNPYGKGKLKDIARFLGIPTMDMDGSDVLDLYVAGEFDKIASYCKADVEMTRAIAHRMGTGNPPAIARTKDPFAAAV